MSIPWAWLAPDSPAWSAAHTAPPAERDVPLSPEVAHHLGRVLRLRPGASVVAFDGQGHYSAGLFFPEGKGARLRLAPPSFQEKPIPLGLVVALTKAEKPDWVVQKATELGATWIGVGLAQRSVARPEESKAEAKLARWQAIALEACAQSERAWAPELEWLGTLCGPVWPEGHQALLLEGREQQGHLPQALAQCATHLPSTLLVGPEGGWTEQELSTFVAEGAELVRLGRGVLRAETAALAALAAVVALRDAQGPSPAQSP